MLTLELLGIINVVAYLTVTTFQLVVVLQRLHTAIIRVSREIITMMHKRPIRPRGIALTVTQYIAVEYGEASPLFPLRNTTLPRKSNNYFGGRMNRISKGEGGEAPQQ